MDSDLVVLREDPSLDAMAFSKVRYTILGGKVIHTECRLSGEIFAPFRWGGASMTEQWLRMGTTEERQLLRRGGFMAAPSAGTKIVLQVGEELRIRNNGDLIVDNPELELQGEDRAADAVLLYRFDAQAGEHILRLLDPVADHQHVKVHKRGD